MWHSRKFLCADGISQDVPPGSCVEKRSPHVNAINLHSFSLASFSYPMPSVIAIDINIFFAAN
eukprot:987745-Lingulodinium_polyedra.AAC.1